MTSDTTDNKENTLLSITATEDAIGQRVDRWLCSNLDGYSRSRIKDLIKEGNLTRDGDVFTDPSWRVREEETFALSLPPVVAPSPEPENIPLDVLFEDEHLIVINKPSGLVVHPTPGNWTGTLVNALLYHCGDSLSGIGGVARPGIVHRLDKDTTGVMVVAKHDRVHNALTQSFSAHEIHRIYVAIVHGAPRPGLGTISTGLARAGADRKKMSVVNMHERPDAKHAVTHYKILENYGRDRAKMPGDSLASLVQCQLETGRTHQIRAHMAHIGHPLLGDQLYGRAPGLSGLRPGDLKSDQALSVLKKFRRQALHARELGFDHPITGAELSFSKEPPKDFADLADALQAL